MLAFWPSAYPSDTILDFFTYAGAPGAYDLSLGVGAGLVWSHNQWSISANYVSTNGENSNPSAGDRTQPLDCGGILTACAGSNGTLQVGYDDDQWGIAAVYTMSMGHNGAGVYGGNATTLAADLAGTGSVNSYGLSGYWGPSVSSWIPNISAGWGITTAYNF